MGVPPILGNLHLLMMGLTYGGFLNWGYPWVPQTHPKLIVMNGKKTHGLGYPYVDFYEVSNIKDMTYLKYRYINDISDK